MIPKRRRPRTRVLAPLVAGLIQSADRAVTGTPSIFTLTWVTWR